MGTFLGHFIPGFFFLSYGLWWAVNIIVRFCQHKYNKAPFKSLAGYPCPCTCCGKCETWPIEGIIKVIMAITGVVGEIISGSQEPTGVSMGDLEHIIMYTFFGLSGVVDILVYNEFPLPEGTDFASLILALAMELVLFLFHLHGRSPLDKHVHMLLVYTLFVTVFILLLQMKYRNSPLLAMSTSFILTIQGTWFIQIGQILYNPIPGMVLLDGDDPESVMIVTIYFVCHIGGVFLFYLLLCLFIGHGYHKCYGSKPLDYSRSGAMLPLISKE